MVQSTEKGLCHILDYIAPERVAFLTESCSSFLSPKSASTLILIGFFRRRALRIQYFACYLDLRNLNMLLSGPVD